LSIAEQRAIGLIPAWSLAFLQQSRQLMTKHKLSQDLVIYLIFWELFKGTSQLVHRTLAKVT